jgi:chromosome segregation ATPase
MRKLQESCDHVQQRANVLEVRINDLKKEALAAKKAGNQRGALLKMKQIKQYQGELVKLDGQLLMLEQQRGMIESSHFDKQVFSGLEQGKKAVDAI